MRSEIASESEQVQPVKPGSYLDFASTKCCSESLHTVLPIKRDKRSQAVFQPAPLSSGDPDVLNFVDICFGYRANDGLLALPLAHRHQDLRRAIACLFCCRSSLPLVSDCRWVVSLYGMFRSGLLSAQAIVAKESYSVEPQSINPMDLRNTSVVSDTQYMVCNAA